MTMQKSSVPSSASAAPPAQSGAITDPAIRRRLRQLALFAAILISGGLLTIPREPLLVTLMVLCFALKNPLRLFKPEFAGIWVLLLVVAAAALIGSENLDIVPMAIRYANFFGALALLAVYVDERRAILAGDLYWILRLMAFQSVLTPIVVILLGDYVTTFQFGDATYFTLGYIFTYHDPTGAGGLIKRPDGFFFEPGVFQFYLNLFLFICLFVRKQRPFDIALGTLAVLATQSTTGVIILLVQFVVVYWVWLRRADRFAKLGVFLFVPILILPLAAYMSYNISEKFYGVLKGSSEAREYDLRTGIAVAFEKPWTGIGFDYTKYYDIASRVGYREAELSRDNITDRGNTNGIILLLYSIGIPLSLVFLLGFVRQRLFKPQLLFAGIALLSLVSESLTYTPIFLMLAFSGLLIQPQRVTNLLGNRRTHQPARAPIRSPARAPV
jgi:hypothetical protein